jgi:hypothetical protein
MPSSEGQRSTEAHCWPSEKLLTQHWLAGLMQVLPQRTRPGAGRVMGGATFFGRQAGSCWLGRQAQSAERLVCRQGLARLLVGYLLVCVVASTSSSKGRPLT